MFTDFNRVMLWVKDLELAKKFYGEGLGMPFISEEYRMPVNFNKAYFGSEKMILELFEWEGPDEYPGRSRLEQARRHHALLRAFPKSCKSMRIWQGGE